MFLICCTLLWACDQPFSYSPYEVNVPSSIRNTTAINLQRIAAIDTVANDSFKVALIADTHYHFDKLKEAVDHINQKNDISFIIVVGDISENGLQKEFELFHSIMANAKVPYLTVIGNHDYLANGGVVYKQLYGPYNYIFKFHNVRFVMWDDVRWESNKTPDWQWLHEAMANVSEEHDIEPTQIIPFSHIPPSDPQLRDSSRVYYKLMTQHNVKVSIHGHTHEFSKNIPYGNGTAYITIGSPQKRAYAELIVTSDTTMVRQIKY
jgi:3',5'-cyclic-AMP phosphodiesterase